MAYVWLCAGGWPAASERCRVLEHTVGTAAQLTERVADIENRSREHWTQLGERLGQLELTTDARSYEQAIGFAKQGEQADRLMSCFGLTEGEANLVRLLHGNNGRGDKELGGRERRSANPRAL